MKTEPLVLGPLLRYVDERSASVWVETRDSALVVVEAGDRSWQARTFAVHGHHYALVEVEGLEPGSVTPYSVSVDGTAVWPRPGSPYPHSVIATLDPGRRLRMAFGSCRTSVSQDASGNRIHGVDALRAYALRLAEDDAMPRPDLAVFLGDQVYADETSEEMREFIEARRDITEPPWSELKDYEEYAHLYALAWSDPANRWLLSTVPVSMIFDDHDIRDDWNTSLTWKRQMEATPWWHGRIVAGLASYWVYQHLGNLSPDERAQDELWKKVAAHDGPEVDLTGDLDALVGEADENPERYRWSFARDIGDVRLVVVDSRAARVLEPARRAMLSPSETAWLDDKMRGGFRHLLVGTSLPFLLSPGLHHFESWNEALVAGAWGGLGGRLGERLRQKVDLEHWAAFERSFREVAKMAVAVAAGERGTPPETVTFLSGDVHHSYVSEVEDGYGDRRTRIVQAVCSPIRNPLPRVMRFATAFSAYGLAGPLGSVMARSAHVPDPPFRWRTVAGPWYDNNLAVLEDRPEGLAMRWLAGVVRGGREEHPDLKEVASVLLRPHGSRAGGRGSGGRGSGGRGSGGRGSGSRDGTALTGQARRRALRMVGRGWQRVGGGLDRVSRGVRRRRARRAPRR